MAWPKRGGSVALQLVGLLLIIISTSSSSLSHAQGLHDAERELLVAAHPPSPPPPPPFKKSPPPPPPAASRGIGVEGTVFCLSCKLPGYLKSLNASPLKGAVAKLWCNDTRHGKKATTDANGYFLIQAHGYKLRSMRSCKVVLSLPPWCNKPVIPKAGKSGPRLRFERVEKIGSVELALFTAGFFEFAPLRPSLCPRLP